MQKALILALLFGAFLLTPFASGQEAGLQCPDGGTLSEYGGQQICSVPAPSGSPYKVTSGGYSATANSIPEAANAVAAQRSAEPGFPPCPAENQYSYQSHTSNGSVVFQVIQKRYSEKPGGGCEMDPTYPRTLTSSGSWSQLPPQHFCPPDNSPKLTNLGGDAPDFFCWVLAVDGVEEPPECNIGDCDPPDEPQCFRGGAGQLVCFEDPNDKCTKNDNATVNDPPEQVFQNCASGCGFVNGNFLCSELPDIPSLDNCLVTTNGYACPPDVPEPDDEIQNSETPLQDMLKGDFKDVLKGVETRTDATNKLLADQIARDAENTQKINEGQGQSNAYLKEIDKNTKKIADAMEEMGGDGDSLDMGNSSTWKSEIQSALGLTGDESIEDLTVDEVSLDEFKDDFSWSIGSSQCPQPRAINMLGKTFYMDWEPFCKAFTVMGYLILAAAYFLAAMIAFKGK